MTTIVFPASVVPAGLIVTFATSAFNDCASFIATEADGRIYRGEMSVTGRHIVRMYLDTGLARSSRDVRRGQKVVLRAVILAAYAYATRGTDTGEQHDAHVEALGWEEHVRDLDGEAVAALNLPEVIPAAPAFVSIDGEAPIAWAEFEAANADGMDAADFAMIRVDLAATGRCTFGGGAGAEFEIVAVPGSDGQRQPSAHDRAMVLDCLRVRDLGGDWLGHESFDAGAHSDHVQRALIADGLGEWADEGFVITPRGRRAWAEQRRALVDLSEGVALAGVL